MFFAAVLFDSAAKVVIPIDELSIKLIEIISFCKALFLQCVEICFNNEMIYMLIVLS